MFGSRNFIFVSGLVFPAKDTLDFVFHLSLSPLDLHLPVKSLTLIAVGHFLSTILWALRPHDFTFASRSSPTSFLVPLISDYRLASQLVAHLLDALQSIAGSALPFAAIRCRSPAVTCMSLTV